MNGELGGRSGRLRWWTAAAALLVAASVAGCSNSNSSDETTTSTSTTTPTPKVASAVVITPASPAGLLPAITHITSTVPTNELEFTYIRDPKDPSWVWFQVNPQPKYAKSVQGGYGYAHLVNGTWQLAGPASSDVGCTASANQIVVPAAVFAQFKQKDPC
jgi:hypothetical protein